MLLIVAAGQCGWHKLRCHWLHVKGINVPFQSFGSPLALEVDLKDAETMEPCWDHPFISNSCDNGTVVTRDETRPLETNSEECRVSKTMELTCSYFQTEQAQK